MRSATAPTRSETSSRPASQDEGARLSGARRSAGFGLYVHWPFCVSKCPYCDFNSHVRDSVDQARWRAALGAEIDHFARLAPGRTLTSVFFGGGTPSLMEAETVAFVLERAAAGWAFADDIEITLEANPSSVESARFAGYRAAGVDRVSIGVQSFEDDALRFLGRAHDSRQALAAIEAAMAVFPRVSFDLIYARPGQTATAWRAELAKALSFGCGHLSLYQLTIEEGTGFEALRRRGELAPLPDDRAAGLYDLSQDILAGAGLPAYEVSNHAGPGAESRHNLTYWRYGEYVGVGPGAHGRLAFPSGGADPVKRGVEQLRSPEAWLASVERHGHGTRETTPLSSRERAEEMLMMGLRLAEGVDLYDFTRETGLSFPELVRPGVLESLVGGGFLAFDEHHLRATPAGLRRLNAVLVSLLG